MCPDLAIYWHLGKFFRPLATINLPKCHSWAIFVKASKSIIFVVKSFLGNFYRHLAIFSGHTAGEEADLDVGAVRGHEVLVDVRPGFSYTRFG